MNDEKCICKICNIEYKTYRALSLHVANKHNINSKDYYDKYYKKENDDKCVICNKPTKYVSLTVGYRKFCCNKCVMLSEETKNKMSETMFKKTGYTHNSYNPKTIQKRKDTFEHKSEDKKNEENLKRSLAWKLKSVEEKDKIQNKIKKTNLLKFGVERVGTLDFIKEKIKNTNLERYGTISPSQNINVKNKYFYTMNNKSIDEKNKTIEKRKNTCLEIYGETCVLKNKDIKNKILTTVKAKYGDNIINVSQATEVKNKRKQTFIKKYGVECFSKSDIFKTKIKKIKYEKLLNSEKFNKVCKPKFNLEEYDGILSYDKKYEFECCKCGNNFYSSLMDGHVPRCYFCYPSNVSKPELEVLEFIQTLGFNSEDIIVNDRTITQNNTELDILIKSKNFALEFNGLYYHSEIAGGKNNKYHLIKTNDCLNKNISLFHIFEDEWYNNRDTIKSMILSKLELIQNKYDARKCEIKEIKQFDADEFLNNNHLQGTINAKHVGLIYNDDLICLISYGKPRYDNIHECEIYRFCNKNYCSVRGGFNKLFNFIKNLGKYNSFISYADKRYSTGNLYIKCGFEKSHETKPNYFYINHLKRINRINYQKHKLKELLETYDENLTEWENMQLNKYDRIWDCGNMVFTYKI